MVTAKVKPAPHCQWARIPAIVVTAQFGSLSITVPVTLTVAAAGTPFFGNMPGQLSFSLKTGAAASSGSLDTYP